MAFMKKTFDYLESQESSPYWSWLEKSTPIDESLKWCHTTDAYALRSIISNNAVNPLRCELFAEKLIYLFYGRPAYRSREHEQIRISAKSPVVIIFSRSVESSGTRIFPFDSGAFLERYDELRHSEMKIRDFKLPCATFAPERQVAEFYGSNANYFSMKSKPPTRSFAGEFEVEAVAEIIQERSTTAADDRRQAIELQVANPVMFAAPIVSAVIVPDLIREAVWFQEWEKHNQSKISIHTYEFVALRTASHYQDTLEKIAKGFQKSEDSNCAK